MGKAIAAWFLVAAAAAAPVATPRDVVQAAVNHVIVVVQERQDEMWATPDGATKRRAELRRIAGDLFDFDEMARRALSRHWTSRTPSEQVEFVQLFTDLLERTYISRIESYAGERILYPAEVIDGSYATVRSRIVVPKRRTETPLDYRLHLVDGRWKVFDIAIDGVSFVSTYRIEFNRIIQQSSYASLVERMRKQRLQIDALAHRR